MATVRLQLRRGLADDWFDANPTLAAGEIGIETDTNTFKFGDGNTPWNSLEYALSGTVDDYIPLSTKAQPGGVASLDSSGFVPVSQLPPLAKVTVNAVADQSARLALTAEAGDIAIQADNGQSYVLSASPASTDANWKALVGSEAVVDTVETALVAGVGLDKTYNDASGTITIDIDSTVATLTGTQTLTNKTLTSPVINTPTGIVKADVGLANVDNTSDANKPVSTATAAAIATAKSQAQGYADDQINLVIGAAPAALNTLSELADALADDANFAATVTSSLATKAPLDSPTFTGTVTLPGSTNIGSVGSTEIGYLDGVTSSVQGQIDTKAPTASPTFTGTVTLPGSTNIGSVGSAEIGYLDGVTSSVQGQIDTKLASADAASTYAPLASPTLTGTVTLPGSTSIGEVGSTEIGYLNGVTSSVQGQIDTKAPIASPTLTGTVTLPGSTSIGEVGSTEIGYLNGVTSSVQGQIDTKAPADSPTFTGTVTLPGSTNIGSVGSTEIGYLDGVTSSVQGQIDTKLASATAASTYAPLASPTFTGTVTLPSGTVTSEMIADGTILDSDVNASAAIAQSKISGLTSDLALKAPLASPTFTGTVSGVTKSMVGLGNVDNTSDANKPVSTAQASAIATAKSEAIADATSQVNAVIAAAPAALDTLDELAAALGDDANFATTITTSLAAKAPLASPTFTGTVSGITKTMVGLGNVDNTADTAKPVSTATQTALDLKAPLASPTFTGTVSGITKTMVGLGNVDNTSDANKPVSTATQTALDAKLASATAASTYAPLASPTFTGTVSGITKTMVGLGNVDNTADTAKPVSTAQSAAIATAKAEAIADATAQVNAVIAAAPAALNTLDELAAALGDDANFATTITTSLAAKAPLASPTFTGTVSGITKTMVGLGNVDNTADTAKPVSTATQTALDLKAPLASPTFTGTVTLPTGTVTSAMILDGTIVNGDINASAAIAQSKISGLTSDLALKAPLASPTFTGTVSGITKTMVGLENVDNTADTAKPVSTAQSAAIATAKAEAIADATAQVNALVTGAPAAMNTLDELAAALGDDANFAASVTTSLGLKVDSLTPISQKTASYTLSSLTERDDLIEMGSATAVTLSIPTDATLNFPIGTSIDILQTGAGQVTIAAVTPGTTTVNATPGLKLRTTWSSCTLLKRAANTWVVFGDLTA